MTFRMTILGKISTLMQFTGAWGSNVTAQHEIILIFHQTHSIIGGTALSLSTIPVCPALVRTIRGLAVVR